MNKDEWSGFRLDGGDVAAVEETDSDRAVLLRGLAGVAFAFGCTWDGCDYASTSLFGVVTGHWKKHVPPTKSKPEIPYGDMTLRQIIEELDDKEGDIVRLADQLERLAEANTKMRAELVELRRLRNAAKRALNA